jgi:hypothetical protein
MHALTLNHEQETVLIAAEKVAAVRTSNHETLLRSTAAIPTCLRAIHEHPEATAYEALEIERNLREKSIADSLALESDCKQHLAAVTALKAEVAQPAVANYRQRLAQAHAAVRQLWDEGDGLQAATGEKIECEELYKLVDDRDTDALTGKRVPYATTSDGKTVAFRIERLPYAKTTAPPVDATCARISACAATLQSALDFAGWLKSCYDRITSFNRDPVAPGFDAGATYSVSKPGVRDLVSGYLFPEGAFVDAGLIAAPSLSRLFKVKQVRLVSSLGSAIAAARPITPAPEARKWPDEISDSYLWGIGDARREELFLAHPHIRRIWWEKNPQSRHRYYRAHRDEFEAFLLTLPTDDNRRLWRLWLASDFSTVRGFPASKTALNLDRSTRRFNLDAKPSEAVPRNGPVNTDVTVGQRPVGL